jgi:D-sedoheptulose 7-phosphate isomerase
MLPVIATKQSEKCAMKYVREHLAETKKIIDLLDPKAVEDMVRGLKEIRDVGGRLFLLGVGGGAGMASHAVNDFRKIAGIEAYTPTDNVSELTARINDDGWEGVFREWLKVSRLGSTDGILVFSVGGGNADRGISANIVEALKYAGEIGAKIFGIVGRDGGYTARVAAACVIIPTVNPESVTPHTEAFQSVLTHLIVSHPDLKQSQMKWETEIK